MFLWDILRGIPWILAFCAVPTRNHQPIKETSSSHSSWTPLGFAWIGRFLDIKTFKSSEHNIKNTVMNQLHDSNTLIRDLLPLWSCGSFYIIATSKTTALISRQLLKGKKACQRTGKSSQKNSSNTNETN